MDAMVRIAVKPTFRQFLRFNQHALYHRVRWLTPLAIFSLVMFLLVPLMPSEGKPDVVAAYRNSVAILFLPGFRFVLLPLIIFFSARSRWHSAAELREPRTYEFSEAGVSTEGLTFRSSVSWNILRRAATSGSLIIIYTAQEQGHLIPLESLSDQGQAEALRALLRKKVPDCSRLR